MRGRTIGTGWQRTAFVVTFLAVALVLLGPATVAQNGPPDSPPGQGGNPPGQGGAPPGQGNPPGQGRTPPGQGSTTTTTPYGGTTTTAPGGSDPTLVISTDLRVASAHVTLEACGFEASITVAVEVTLLGETLLDEELLIGPDGCLLVGGGGRSALLAASLASSRATITVPLAGPGTYLVCLHAAGHPSTCDSFEVAAPASASSPGGSSTAGTGLPGWVALAAGLGVVAVATLAGITGRRASAR
jgi:hypothetical protein